MPIISLLPLLILASCDSTTSGSHPFPAESLDVQPSLAPPYPRLHQPPSLAMAAVTGDVLLEYEIDSTGVVDRCSIRIVLAKRPEFVASAKAFVASLHFTPGIRNGGVVRARVQQRIRFRKTNGDRGKHHVF